MQACLEQILPGKSNININAQTRNHNNRHIYTQEVFFLVFIFGTKFNLCVKCNLSRHGKPNRTFYFLYSDAVVYHYGSIGREYDLTLNNSRDGSIVLIIIIILTGNIFHLDLAAVAYRKPALELLFLFDTGITINLNLAIANSHIDRTVGLHTFAYSPSFYHILRHHLVLFLYTAHSAGIKHFVHLFKRQRNTFHFNNTFFIVRLHCLHASHETIWQLIPEDVAYDLLSHLGHLSLCKAVNPKVNCLH